MLNTTNARDIANSLLVTLEDLGYDRDEEIAGLIQAVIEIAGEEDSLLDEAANLLADGGVQGYYDLDDNGDPEIFG